MPTSFPNALPLLWFSPEVVVGRIFPNIDEAKDILKNVSILQFLLYFHCVLQSRALQYCLEDKVNLLSDNDWIVHLDEETVITEDCIKGK